MMAVSAKHLILSTHPYAFPCSFQINLFKHPLPLIKHRISFHKELIITTNTHESAERGAQRISQQLRSEKEEEKMMKSLFEELGGTYTLGKDGMYYPELAPDGSDTRSIGRWDRMHMKYLESEHPGLYEQLILNGTLHRYLVHK